MQKNRLLLLAVGAVMLIVVVLAMGVFFAKLAYLLPKRTMLPTGTLVQQIQTLNQLVTVKYVMEKAVVFEDVKWYGESRVIIVAHGVVKAGVDLGQLKEGDIDVDQEKKRVRVKLPPAVITDAYLDDGRTQILERNTGLLRTFDKNLEQDARRSAVDEIKRAARLNGIQKDAEERAQIQLANLFKQLGFTEVEIKLP